MNPDLYGAWLTAGNNLQPYGHWIARNADNLGIALILAIFATWCIRRGCRGLGDANRRVNAAIAEIDQPRKEK